MFRYPHITRSFNFGEELISSISRQFLYATQYKIIKINMRSDFLQENKSGDGKKQPDAAATQRLRTKYTKVRL